jgi:hydrogenase expression/formation protein HypC
MCLAVPGRVQSIDDEGATTRAGRVSFGGVERRVGLAFVSDARVGDYVLVHAGFAIARIDEAEAAKVFDYLEEIGAVAQELG